ncbi:MULTISPECIES: hypothetical protein [Protofrankia]|uniref:Lsr2 protein n=1 Tax=Protofrankia coriariae TaxID=1562887 RepID=A0ABR5F291_9ACTN|nr:MULTISPECIES: hypothetical protein [Protofrankia]KLL10815.1 hypothetical protein FrCorBMG51_15470 [Protofrankia coriariae]ONH34017.1 hypothetical protein BL254_18435 [Protofrankia sp. BMG5.30]
MTVELIRRVVADDPALVDLLDQALQNPHGGDRSKFDNVQDAPEAPTGNSETAALRRLRKEADAGNEQAAELRSDVLAGRISAHQAMVRAGYRPKTTPWPVRVGLWHLGYPYRHNGVMDRMVTGIILRCSDHRRPKTGLDAYRVPPRELCERCRAVGWWDLGLETEKPDPSPKPFRPFLGPV